VTRGDVRLRPEDRLKAKECAEDGVADDRGNEAGNDRLDLEIVQVQDLGGHDRAAERRPEDGADPGAHPRRHGDPAILWAQPKPRRQQRAEARGYLRSGPFAAA
jgi:hypothetical protein